MAKYRVTEHGKNLGVRRVIEKRFKDNELVKQKIVRNLYFGDGKPPDGYVKATQDDLAWAYETMEGLRGIDIEIVKPTANTSGNSNK